MNELSDLCRPVLRRVCEYWLFRRAGAEPSAEEALDAISADLVSIRRRAEESPRLEKLFRQIEEPLIFFIDYTIKEGGFRFSGSWRELARDFNELSGDEKFFDLLEEAKKAPDSAERIAFFFLLLGLGFDGMHRADKRLSVEALQACAAIAPPARSINAERLSPEPQPLTSASSGRRLWQRPAFALAASLMLALAAFAWNTFSLRQATEPLRDALERTTYAAAPHLFAYQPDAILSGSEDDTTSQAAPAVRIASETFPAAVQSSASEIPARAQAEQNPEPSAQAPEQKTARPEVMPAREKAQDSAKTAKSPEPQKAAEKPAEGQRALAQTSSAKAQPARKGEAPKKTLPAQAKAASGMPSAPADDGGWTSIGAAAPQPAEARHE